MGVDRFTSGGPRIRNARNTERFHPAPTGVGDGGLNTEGPWVGPADPDDRFGLDPATGMRYYVDENGDWQPIDETDLNTTREVVAGDAPAANTIPASVASQDRDDGDFHIIGFDDYTVTYKFGTPITEIKRQPNMEGGFETITLDAVAPLDRHPNQTWLRDYVITATGPLITVTVDGVDFDVVRFPLEAPTADSQRLNVIRSSAEHIYLDGSINGQTGLVINQNLAQIQLRSFGGFWWHST